MTRGRWIVGYMRAQCACLTHTPHRVVSTVRARNITAWWPPPPPMYASGADRHVGNHTTTPRFTSHSWWDQTHSWGLSRKLIERVTLPTLGDKRVCFGDESTVISTTPLNSLQAISNNLCAADFLR